LGEEILISTKNYKARFATIPPEEFPAIPKIEKGFKITVDAQDLARSISRVAFNASLDEGRPVLTGVLFEVDKNKLSMVATDGYRLGFCEILTKKGENPPSFKIIIPARALMELAKIIDELGFAGEGVDKTEGEEIIILVSESLNQINFHAENIEFTSRLIEGEFPNWRKTIPQEFTTRVKIPKAEFKNLIKIASIFARDLGSVVKLKFEVNSNNKAGVLNVSTSANQIDAKCEVEIKGKGGEIAFNFRYLQEILSVIGDEEVNFEMIESLNPGKLTGQTEKDSFFHIIMPVRLQG
jgi:DNA polymerase-3 subunit beta